MLEIKDRFENSLPSDFVRFEGEDLRFSLPGNPLDCLIGLEPGMPVLDAWALRLEVAAPAPLQPNWPNESKENWLDVGVKGTYLADYKYTAAAERDYWTASDIDGLLQFVADFAIPWLRRIQNLEEMRAFYECALSGGTEASVDGRLDDSRIITMFQRSRNRSLLNKNLGLVCYWQKDYVAALRHLARYRDTIFARYETVRNPEVNKLHVDRLKLVQDLVDEVSALCNIK